MVLHAKRRRRARGKWISCSCHGGIVADCYGGPAECRYCVGGRYWRYPSGALALYPGGPFCGKDA